MGVEPVSYTHLDVYKRQMGSYLQTCLYCKQSEDTHTLNIQPKGSVIIHRLKFRPVLNRQEENWSYLKTCGRWKYTFHCDTERGWWQSRQWMIMWDTE